MYYALALNMCECVYFMVNAYHIIMGNVDIVYTRVCMCVSVCICMCLQISVCMGVRTCVNVLVCMCMHDYMYFC